LEKVSTLPVQEAAAGHADLLADTGFFGELTPAQLERVAELCSLQRFPEGALVYSLGSPASTFYVLVDGIVRFTIAMGTRQAAAGQLIRRGEVFGWAALVEPTPARIASAACVRPCTVLCIDGKKLLALAEMDHSIGYRIMKQLSALISANLTSFAAG
jgi:toluene monooxygenase system ferredoxin subunit